MIQYHLDHHFFEGKNVGKFILTQVGRLWGTATTHFPPHIQGNYYELTLVTKGTGTILTNSIPVEVQEGDIYISIPSDIHEIKSDTDDPISYDFFTFTSDDEYFIRLLNVVSEKIPDPRYRIIHKRRLFSLVEYAIEELENETEHSACVLENICELVCTYLYRTVLSAKTTSHSYEIDKATSLCYKIMNYIDNNLFSIEKLEELATITNYNYSYLSALFKKKTGKTILEYYSEKKLLIAKKLLQEKKLKGVEIAELLHYSSYFAFSKAFKAKFGISPKAYKQTASSAP